MKNLQQRIPQQEIKEEVLKENEIAIYGPPGTGKTTKLLNIIEEAIADGVNPERIAFLSFTRKAAQEAIDRASLKFNLDQKHFPHFRTLHSLAFRWAGFGKCVPFL